MDFEAIKKAAQAYGPDMTRFLRDMTVSYTHLRAHET